MAINSYYKKDLEKLYKFLVPSKIKLVRIKKPELKPTGKFEYIILDNVIGELDDIQSYLEGLRQNCTHDSRIIISYYNHLWEPILKAASKLGLRKKQKEQNWISNEDIVNLLQISGYDVVSKHKRLLFPIDIPVISYALNKWVATLPVINTLCLTTWVVARVRPIKKEEYSVTIVIAARNEEGNIPKIIPRIPKFGKSIEVIYVEGNSKDKTWEAIEKETKKKFKNISAVRAFKQKGKGKGDAVRVGFAKAQGEVLMILDADMTVPPEDLPKFYNAISDGLGEYINGTRLVYPMEDEAMRFLNKIGNIVFSKLFTWILGQRFTDTLCGTKVITKKHYKKIEANRSYFGDFDPFGDFDLIFGAVKQHLKVVEVPIRYRERTYGSTNISRFRHAILLFRMTWLAFLKLKAL